MLRGDLSNIGHGPEERHQGWSPPMKSVEEGHAEIMRALLDERGADLEVVNKKGRSALSFAAAPSRMRPTRAAALRLLLEKGADPSRRDNNGLSCRARAARENREDALHALDAFAI